MIAPELPLAPTEKLCSGPCGRLLPLEAFGRHSKAKDGLNWWCKACNAAHAATHYRANRQAKILYQQEYAARHKEEARAARLRRRAQLGGPALDALKVCARCGVSKSLAAFHRLPDSADGHHGVCALCRNEMARLYRAAYPQRVRASQERWARANMQRLRAARRKRRAASPERFRKWGRDAYTRRREDFKRRVKAYRLAHPEQALAWGHARRARSHRAPGRWTPADIALIYEAQRGRCAYCLAPLGVTFHRDHMIPVGRPGSSNWPHNICLTCPHCNWSKNVQSAGQYMARLIKERRSQAAV